MGFLMLTSPLLWFVLMEPIGKPSSRGFPRAVATLSSALARAIATLYGSELFKAADTPEKMAKMLKPNTATARTRPSNVPRQQPVGTNHFQFRLHHPGAGCPCIGVSMGAFSPPTRVASSIFWRSRAVLQSYG